MIYQFLSNIWYIRILFIVVLNVIMLSAFMLIVIMLNVIMLNVIMLNVMVQQFQLRPLEGSSEKVNRTKYLAENSLCIQRPYF
jgi:hypothetical protein